MATWLESHPGFGLGPLLRGPLANVSSGVRTLANDTIKRTIDLVGASFLIVFLSPLMVTVAILVTLGSNGPVFYGHERIGSAGRKFRCWKFRSMVSDADAVLATHLALSSTARAEWSATRKLRHDPRITPLGEMLRRLSIDELPQLANVIRGEMSLVGPRPVTTGELALYGSSSRHYLRVRPGITGLWQVSGRSEMSYARRVALDRAYVTRCGSGADVAILLRTIPAVLKTHGAW